MAEFGAHLTSGGGGEDNAPSIFEVLAQENLMTALRPALKYASRVLAENQPERFGWLHRANDEVYTALDLLLQTYYLKHYSGSFAENFYSLKRVPFSKGESENLDNRSRLKSLLFLVFIPYLKNKADALYEGRDPDTLQGAPLGWPQRLYWVFLRMYPTIHMLYQTAVFTCQLLYTFGRVSYHSPWLQLAGVRLENLSMSDMMSQQPHGLSWDWRKHSVVGNIRRAVNSSVGLAAIALSSGLSGAVFFLQFLEWWYASDQNANAVTSLPVPPPPPQLPAKEDLPKLPSICPLCRRVRTNDTTLAVSGYVFCYPCIYRHLVQHKRCPVTNYPATTQHLVKLYLTES